MKFHCIHGFLGSSNDWNFMNNHFPSETLIFHSITDYLNKDDQQNDAEFLNWSKKFNESTRNLIHKNQKSVLIGYSLGGRLALHALDNDAHWDAVVIISANPGLSDSSLKNSRIENDNKWASRFLNENWDEVMKDWNSQGVFSGKSNDLNRSEHNYNRKDVATVLTKFSLGKQEDLRKKIFAYNKPLLWISGEEDKKFSDITKELAVKESHIDFTIIPSAGHRVPWENENAFINTLKNFLFKRL